MTSIAILMFVMCLNDYGFYAKFVGVQLSWLLRFRFGWNMGNPSFESLFLRSPWFMEASLTEQVDELDRRYPSSLESEYLRRHFVYLQ